MPQLDREATSVPAAACRLAGGAFQFGDGPDGEGRYPVKMLARSGKPIEHWYWGRVVHDLAGMKSKPTIPVDFRHRDDQPLLGYLDQFDVASGDLVVEGALVPYGDEDRVHEIAHKARAGVPYEASIDFGGDGIVLEEVGNGASVQVNGYTFDGPGVVIRQWPLRGVAICPYGADANTRTELAASDNVPIRFTQGREDGMPVNQTDKQEARSLMSRFAKLFGLDGESTPESEPEKPAEQLGKETPEEPEKPADQLSTEKSDAPTLTEPAKPQAGANPGKRFVDAFGDKGGRWFAEGLSFEDAQARHIAELEDANAALTKKLEAVDRGEEEPAEFGSGEADESEPGTAEKANFGALSGLVAFNQDKLGK